MNGSEINQFWHLADVVSIREAAALIAGYDPKTIDQYSADSDFNKSFPDYYPVYTAVINAVRSMILKAEVRYLDGTLHDDCIDHGLPDFLIPTATYELDDNSTTIVVEDLKTWLESRGFSTGFFFQKQNDVPDYLDQKHPHYSQKLAAAVKAWQAVVTDLRYKNNGKSVKRNLENWLTAHACEFGLLKSDGELNSDAIGKQISKVANWEDRGGAPKTPVQKPSTH